MERFSIPHILYGNTLKKIILFSLFCGIMAPFAFGQTMFYLSPNGARNFYSVDIATGVATLIGPSGIGAPTMLVADDATGNLYASTFDARFYSIDKVTGVATLIGNIDIVSPSFVDLGLVEGISYNPDDGMIYAAAGLGGLGAGILVTIDPATGNATEIGPMGSDNDRIFFSNGTLYTADFPDFYSVDFPGTLTRTLIISPLASTVGGGWAQDAASPGFVYATRDSDGALVTVDPTTATVLSTVGLMGIPPAERGGELVILPSETAPIPTLSQWGLIILGLCLLSLGVIFIWRRRRSLSFS